MVIGRSLSKIQELRHQIDDIQRENGSGENVQMPSDTLREIQASLREIEESRQAEEALRAREAYLWATLLSIQDEIWIVDMQGRVVLVNHAVEENLGVMQDRWEDIYAAIADLELFYPDGTPRPPDMAPLARSLRGETLVAEQEIVRHLARGELRWREVSSAPICDPQGHITGAVLVARDITERKKMEEHLKESKDKLRSLFELLPIGISIVNGESEVIDANPALEKILGIPREELLVEGHSGMRCIRSSGKEMPKEESPGARALLLGDGTVQNAEMGVVKEDGSVIWTDVNAAPLPFHDWRAVIATSDITARKRAEEELRREKGALEAIMENTNAQLACLDPKFRFIEVNSAYALGSGYRKDDLIGRNHFDLFPDAENQEIFQRVVDSGESVRFFAKPFQYADQPWRGTTYWNWSLVPVKDSAGSVEALVFSLLDVTEQIRMEEALRKANEELELRVQERTADLLEAKDAAEAAAKAKAAFMANVSHELRTPMNYIIGMTSLLLSEPLTPDLKEQIEIIRKGGDEMMSMINDILDFSKVEKELVILEQQPLSLRALVDESLEMVASQATKKGLKLTSNVRYGTPEGIFGDQGRLRQVLVNILSNAVKFTDKGDVSLFVSSKPLGNERHQILFQVNDTGIGISPEKMGELFQPFSHVETTISRKRDGAGLGLAISKGLVELMGGEIWADSTPGLGSRFYFTVEAEIAHDDSAKNKRAVGAIPERIGEERPLAILVAEDVPSNQKVILEMLKRMGYRADAVADGKEVLQALQVRPYDIILMDVKMPEMDGLEAARQIRERWPAHEQPVIIAVTAFALEGDRERCIEAGMDDYIAKPLMKDDLAALLRKIASPTRFL